MLTSCRIVPELRNQLTFLLQLLKVFLLYQCAMLTGFTEDISVSMKASKNLPIDFSFITEYFSKPIIFLRTLYSFFKTVIQLL